MELRHLRYFVAVAEEQNITRAAARLHVSQPPLSRQIRDLEEELSVRLLDRGPRSVRLTEVGKVFLEEARGVLRRVNEAVVTVRTLAGAQPEELHVGYAPSLTVELLPRALRRFQEGWPGVRVTLHDLSTEAMFSGLLTGGLHVALMIRPPGPMLRKLVFQELHRYPVCVASHPSHPFARVKRPRLTDLSRERLIVYDRGEYPEYHRWLETLFARRAERPVLAEEHDSATSLIASVEGGRGIALVPESLACLTGSRLCLRPLLGGVTPFVVGVAHRRGQAGPLTVGFTEACAE